MSDDLSWLAREGATGTVAVERVAGVDSFREIARERADARLSELRAPDHDLPETATLRVRATVVEAVEPQAWSEGDAVPDDAPTQVTLRADAVTVVDEDPTPTPVGETVDDVDDAVDLVLAGAEGDDTDGDVQAADRERIGSVLERLDWAGGPVALLVWLLRHHRPVDDPAATADHMRSDLWALRRDMPDRDGADYRFFLPEDVAPAWDDHRDVEDPRVRQGSYPPDWWARAVTVAGDGWACDRCGTTGDRWLPSDDAVVTHRLTDVDAPNAIENLIVLCGDCHGAADERREIRHPDLRVTDEPASDGVPGSGQVPGLADLVTTLHPDPDLRPSERPHRYVDEDGKTHLLRPEYAGPHQLAGYQSLCGAVELGGVSRRERARSVGGDVNVDLDANVGRFGPREDPVEDPPRVCEGCAERFRNPAYRPGGSYGENWRMTIEHGDDELQYATERVTLLVPDAGAVEDARVGADWETARLREQRRETTAYRTAALPDGTQVQFTDTYGRVLRVSLDQVVGTERFRTVH